MNWDDLKIVAAVAEHGTFAGAARALRQDETTVARRLERLQRTLDLRLFDTRDGRRLPTPECAAILSEIDGIGQSVARIDAIRRQTRGTVGRVRVASTSSIAEYLIAPAIGQLLRDAPGLSLDMRLSGANVDFGHWEADLAIRLAKPETGGFKVRKLFSFPLYLLQPASSDPEDPGAATVCAYPAELDGTPEMQTLSGLGLHPGARLITESVAVIRSAIDGGRCSGILPGFVAASLMQDSRIRVTDTGVTRGAWLLIQPHLRDDPATRLVIDWLVSLAAQVSAGT